MSKTTDPSRRRFLGGAGLLAVGGYPARALARVQSPHAAEALRPSREVYGFCDMCYWRCGLKIRVRNGRAVKIEGNPEHPNNRGVVCAKGNAGLMAAYDPDRLKFPLLRVGERGAGKWKRITWDEAYDRIAAAFLQAKKQYGPETLAMIGHGTWEKPYHRLAHAFGTPNTTSPVFGLCCGPRDVANQLVAGRPLGGNETLDLENCRYFLMMGRNITESLHNGETLGWIEAVAKGAQVVYVDPRYTVTASKAKEWLPIRPLTDHAFLLALIHVLIEERLYDAEFVTAYTLGLEELTRRVARYAPEWAEEECGIAARDIRRIARELAAHAPAALVYSPRRLTRTSNDLGTGLAISILNALLGVWDREGGIFSPLSFPVPEPDLPPFPHAEAPRADGAGVEGAWPLANAEYGLTNQMWSAIAEQKPYPIKLLLTAGGNGFMNSTDFDSIRRAIGRLDFFVAADIAPNEMNQYADILLPEASYLERYDDLQTGGAKEGFVAVRMPAMAPLHDTRDAWTICKQLAERLGLGAWFPHASAAELIDERLRKAGLSLAELETKGIVKKPADPARNFPREHGLPSVFPTPSGKVELVPGRLQALGMDDALDYVPQGRPEEDEFHFTFGRIGFHTHARTQNNRWLADLMGENELWVHPDAAARQGIRDGDRVEVEDRDGRKERLRAKVTRRIRPDTVFMVHGFGHFDPRMGTAHGKGAADSNLASRDRDERLGTVAMGRSLVRVRKL